MHIPLPAKLMASYLLVAGLITVPSLFFLRLSLVRSLESAEARELRGRAEAVRDALEVVPQQGLDAAIRDHAKLLNLRITVIDEQGRVLADSAVAPANLPSVANHLDRPEVRAALAGEYGVAMRKSATVGEEFVYCAVAIPKGGKPWGVVRLASRISAVHEAVSEALLALRLAAGVGVSAALLLSLIGAMYVSSPLRRMRDAARNFADARWVGFKKVRTGDELEELSDALDGLGQRFREHLVEVGAQEALLTQALQAFPLPAVLLKPDLSPVTVNGAFRKWAAMTPANEASLLSALARTTALAAARKEAEVSGLATELSLPRPLAGEREPARPALLAPLARPAAPPQWLLIADLQTSPVEDGTAEELYRALNSAERVIAKLWASNPEQHAQLAQLRATLDEAAQKAGRPQAMGVEPVRASELLERSAAHLTALHPELAERLACDASGNETKVAESAGLGERAVRIFLRSALRNLPAGRRLEVSLRTEGNVVRVLVEGAAPRDLEPARRLVRALGTDAGVDPVRAQEAAWLSLPRA